MKLFTFQNLDSQLRQMTDDLCKVIEHLNNNNSSSQASDPVTTIARVLSAHMDTLKWVDQNSALLSQKVDDLSRAADSKRRDWDVYEIIIKVWRS